MCSNCNANSGKMPNSISEPTLFTVDATIVNHRIRWCRSHASAALAAKDTESTTNGTVPLMANNRLPNGGPANWATVVSDV